jgi:hypothetical protein
MTGDPTRGNDIIRGIHKERTMLGHSEKMAVCKSRKDASEESNPAGTLILGF